MNIKKIGLTALAGSLVATSAFAGAISVSGGASLNVEHTNGGAANSGKTFSMGNQLTFTGGGELDNGLNVSVSFVLDQGDDKGTTTAADDNAGAPFDNHSLSVGSDTFGTLVFHGEGGESAESALDTTAAGNIWDNFDGASDLTVKTSAKEDNMIVYTLPTLMDGVKLDASYVPSKSGKPSATAYAVTYTGIDGLTIAAGKGDGNVANTTVDVTTIKVSYAYGPVTVGYSTHDYDHTTATSDQETNSWKVSYTVSDELSISYGAEKIDDGATGSVEDGEYASISAAYTAGGMTLSAARETGDNIDGTATATKDRERWALSASFAF